MAFLTNEKLQNWGIKVRVKTRAKYGKKTWGASSTLIWGESVTVTGNSGGGSVSEFFFCTSVSSCATCQKQVLVRARAKTCTKSSLENNFYVDYSTWMESSEGISSETKPAVLAFSGFKPFRNIGGTSCVLIARCSSNNKFARITSASIMTLCLDSISLK